jgi:hypothetical protein
LLRARLSVFSGSLQALGQSAVGCRGGGLDAGTAEIEDRQDEQAVARVAAVDVAKTSGVVCTGCRVKARRVFGR